MLAALRLDVNTTDEKIKKPRYDVAELKKLIKSSIQHSFGQMKG